jgi:hypothetical protein
MRAEDWRDRRERREASRATLRNLREELRFNRSEVSAALPYHRQLAESLGALHGRGTPARNFGALQRAVGWQGFRQLRFRHAAWDLALVSQSLGHIDTRLAFSLADVYERQAALFRYQEAVFASAVSMRGVSWS